MDSSTSPERQEESHGAEWRLDLTNFKCFKQRTISFSDGLTLIKGVNGVGKSTLVEALCWCLYGICQTSIAPWSKPSARTTVSLRCGDLEITRKTHPQHLTIRQGDKHYSKEEAQDIITRIFGEEELFMRSYYMPPRSLHILLTGSSVQKSQFIHTLSYGGDVVHPTTLLTNVEVATRALEQERMMHRAALGTIGTCDHDTCPEVAKGSVADARKEYAEAQNRLLSLEKEVSRLELELERSKTRDELRSRLDSSMTSDVSELKTLVNSLQQERKTSEQQEAVRQRRSVLESLLRDYSEISTLSKYSDTQLRSELTLLRQASHTRPLVEKYGLKYDSENVDSRVKRLREVATRTDVRKRLTKELESLPRDNTSELRSTLDELESKYSTIPQLHDGVAGHPCPQCGTVLATTPSGLIKASITKEERNKIQQQRETLQASLMQTRVALGKAASIRARRETLEEELKTLTGEPGEELTDAEQIELKELSRIQVVKTLPDITCDEVERELQRRAYTAELLALPTVSVRHSSEIDLLLSVSKQQLSICEQLPETNGETTSAIQTILEASRHKLLGAREQVEKALETLQLRESQEVERQRHRDCDKQRAISRALDDAEQRYTTAVKTKAVVEREYHQRMLMTMNELNRQLTRVCAILYPNNDLLVQLNNQKKLKSDQMRHGVSVQVFVDGVDVGPRGVSCGQETRVSYALMLAVQAYRPCPLMIHDEVFYGLDHDMRSACTEALRDISRGCSVLVLEQNEDDTEYDACLVLE